MDKLKKKAIVMILIEVICLVGLGVYLTGMQNHLSLQQQRRDTEQKIVQIRELVQTTGESTQRLKETVDGIYQSKAMSLAYMVREEVDPELTDDVLSGYRKLLGVDNVFILDMDGNVLCQAKSSKTDFTRARYNQLRTVFSADAPSQAFEVDMGESQLRYYGAMIDRGRMAVVAQDPAELDRLTEETSSWKSVLENVSVGLDGYSFVISAKDYTFLYHPDQSLIGLDALDAGVRVEDLEDGGSCWMTVNGQELYCGVVKADDVYILCAVTRGEINSANAITVIIVLFVFFTAITIVVFYAILLLKEERTRAAAPQNGTEDEPEGEYKPIGPFRWHKRVGRKLVTVSALGLLCILAISFYMQTLFSMSRASLTNTQRLEEIEMTLARYQENVDMLTEQYNTSYVSKGETAAYILGRRPDIFDDKERLSDLSQALGVEYIFVFDKNGKIAATDSPYTNFILSENPEEQSYEFRQLLQGVPYLVQPAQKDDVGVYRQYVGVTIRDENGDANGFVQVSVQPELLANAVDQLSLGAVLQNIRVGVNGFAFAVDRDTKNFIYYPEQRYIGRSAAEHGMGEKMFQDGDSGYLTLGLDKYYGAAIETDEAFVYVVIPANELFGDRVLISLSTTGVSLLCLALMCLLLCLERQPSEEEQQAQGRTDAVPEGPDSAGKRARMVDVVMPDGSVKKTESAFSRWSNQALGWGEMTAEQKTLMVLKVLLGILALFIVVAVANKEAAFTRTSVFRYVIDGTWTRGVNVFAITASIMILCVVSVVSMVLRSILKFLSRSMSARGETVIRLVNNLVKYVTVIVAMYFCFAMFGVDTATLLASAGILSLVIGLGVQDLVKDIVAGLFIIFEGEFRVGDIVTIGDWRGTVVEIGVRTTKIEEPGKNIKIINNSAISNVINMTRKESFAACDIGIEYGESLERVEAILAQELPNVRQHLPKITDGPFYKGVASLADSGVVIKIVAQCAEGDRIQMARDLNREMKLIFDKYKINVPFPQVVINQPVEFQEATAWEKRKAERFAEEQRNLGKDLESTDHN